MCCSVSPGVRVEFSDTVLYAAEVIDAKGETVHVLGYQNKARNGSGGAPLASLAGLVPLGRTGNAMILPFPAVPATMTEANVLDTSRCKDVLQDMARAVAPPRYSPLAFPSRSASKSAAPPKVQVFRAAGIYTVVLAQDPRDIPGAIGRVPRSKRPALNPELFEAYAAWYPGWTIALCCFNNRRARLAHPLLWWYRPIHLDRLFLPALDCHTGDVPDLAADVAVDHVLAVGSHRMASPRWGAPTAHRVHYRDAIPEGVAPYLLPSLVGDRFETPMPNGDFVCQLADVEANQFRPARVRPGSAALVSSP